MPRDCPHCGKCFGAAKGLARHMAACRGPKKVPRWRYRTSQRDDEASSRQIRSGSGQNWTDWVLLDQKHGERGPEEHAIDVDTEFGSFEDANTTANKAVPLDGGFDPPVSETRVNEPVSTRLQPPTAPTVSSSIATVIDTYIEVEGGVHSPGRPCPIEESIDRPTENLSPLYLPLPVQPLRTLPSDYFAPFQGLAEYELCFWLFKSQTTAGNMKQFFETNIEPWKHLTEIRSVDMWKQVLHRIPYGIPNDVMMERQITISLPGGCEDLVYNVKYRSIMNVIRFLIGHEPFKRNLTYAPVRLYKDEEKTQPMWNEMHTGSWWWDTQKTLPPGSTVIPVIIASDKTLLTQHRGDKSSHPVYITIGNLDKATRRSQTRPSKILLGFLPIPTKGDDRRAGIKAFEFKRIIYNQAMEVMTEGMFRKLRLFHVPFCLRSLSMNSMTFDNDELGLARAGSVGTRLRCADGQTRHCYPIIAGFVADYEEQVLITGVKSGQHCVTCQIRPDDRANLTPLERYPLRTHQYTQGCIKRLRKQRQRGGHVVGHASSVRGGDTGSNDPAMQVDDIVSFMWKYPRSNMHEIMQVDILHWLFKGVVHRMLTDWVYSALVEEFGEVEAGTLLDERFGLIPRFQSLKTSIIYTAITQWTGAEQKALLRQLVPALAPLLSQPRIQFVRAVVDFTLHAQYHSHDADTLSWMEAALRRIDLLKEAFEDYTAAGNGFNIPKLHAITHFPMMIRKFGSADGYDTSMFELAHKTMVKDWYKLTNKRETFEQQILEHNQRAVNMLAMRDLFEYRLGETLVLSKKEEPAQVTTVTRAEDLENLGWTTSRRKENIVIRALQRNLPQRDAHPYLRRGDKYWRYASTVANFSGIDNLLEALAVFVREERRRLDGVKSSNIELNQREPDCSWVDNLLVCVHPSLICWKVDRDDGSNVDVRKKEFVRCDPRWQGGGEWRRDYVWVQEYAQDEKSPRPLQGRLPAQVLIILSVMDTSRPLEPKTFQIYTGALLDVYTLKNLGRQSEKHGMIEAQRHPPITNTSSRSLGFQRFYHLGLLLRSAHLVPISSKKRDEFYINPYADWDQYVSVFDPEFLEKDARIAESIKRQYQ